MSESKKQKIKNIFTRNIGIKILSVVIAFVIWLTVVNISNPEKTVTIPNVPINILNENAILDQGKAYDVKTRKKVNITVTGKRSAVSDLKADDFIATASLSELSLVNACPVTVRVKNPNLAKEVRIVSQSVNTVNVDVEDMTEKEFPVEIEFKGQPQDGRAATVGSQSFNTVKIKGAKSVLNKIGRVVAYCNVDGVDKDFSKKCRLVILDKNDDKYSTSNAILSKKKVKVYVHMSDEKEVPISLATPGKPKKGYKVDSVEMSQNAVKLVGEAKALKKVNQLTITDKIDLSGKSNDTEVEFDLNKYVPEKLSIDGDTRLQVIIHIKKK